MRYAVISDIHANLLALSAVINDISRESVDQIVCCGDLVGYFTEADECIREVRNNNIISIAGNHDLLVSRSETDISGFWDVAQKAIHWTRANASPDSIAYLRDLPRRVSIDDEFVLFHGALSGEPFPEMARIETLQDAEHNFACLHKQFPGIGIGFFGHIHRPKLFSYANGDSRELDPCSQSLSKNGITRYIVNPGSVGLPRDGDPRASYVIYDSDSAWLDFRRVAFDTEPAVNAARKAGLWRGPRYKRILKRFFSKLRFTPRDSG